MTPSEMTNDELRKRANKFLLNYGYDGHERSLDPFWKKVTGEIYQALLSVREEAVKECLEIANREILVSRQFNLERTGTAEIIRNQILALLPTNEPKEKV